MKDKIEDHWLQYYEQSLKQIELCEKELARLAIERSGQLQIEGLQDLPETSR